MTNIPILHTLHSLLPDKLHDVLLRLTGWLWDSTFRSTALSVWSVTHRSNAESRASLVAQRSFGTIAASIGLPSSLDVPRTSLYATPGRHSDTKLNIYSFPGVHPLRPIWQGETSPSQSTRALDPHGTRSLLIETGKYCSNHNSSVPKNIGHGTLVRPPSYRAFLQALQNAVGHRSHGSVNPTHLESSDLSSYPVVELQITSAVQQTSPGFPFSESLQTSRTSTQWIRDLPDPRFQKCLFRKVLLARTVDLVVALEQCRRKNIYLTIKPENISMDDSDHLVVSSGLQHGDALSNETLNRITDVHYAAPELLEGRKYSRQCDIWSLGVVLFEMHAKLDAPYFSGLNGEDDVAHLVQNKPIDFGLIHCQAARSLIRKMLEHNPKKRFGLHQTMAHPYFQFVNWHNEMKSERCRT